MKGLPVFSLMAVETCCLTIIGHRTATTAILATRYCQLWHGRWVQQENNAQVYKVLRSITVHNYIHCKKSYMFNQALIR